LLAVSLAAGLGALRLTRAGDLRAGAVAITGCVVAGHVVVGVCSRTGPAVGRRRVPGAVLAGAVAAGTVAVAVVASWALLWASTRTGLPTPTTLRMGRSWLAEAGSVIGAGPTPVPATTGILLCLALGAGALAVLGRTLWAWQLRDGDRARRPLLALVPAFGYFVYCALLSSNRSRVPATVAILGAGLVFMATADRAVDAGAAAVTRTAASAPRRPGAAGWLGATSALLLALVLVLVTAPALASMHVDAFPDSAGIVVTGGGGGAGTVALLDNLAAADAPDDRTVLFTARTAVPTYWQVATLTNFDGVDWTAEADTLDTALPEPTGPTFRAGVDVAALRTTLLPTPPGTEQVSGSGLRVGHGGNVEAPSFSGPGTHYAVVARLPAGVAGGPALIAGDATDAAGDLGAGVPAAALAPFLTLPTMSPRVAMLAHRIVTGSPGPLAEADALVRYLDSGRYGYSAQPPPATDPDPLSGFLFETRTGFCQQFAGAFAALARVVGLPVRIAVGFGAGSPGSDGRVTVRAADAHTWPEVYFGPRVGWLSFEPTPGGSAPPGSVRQGRTPTLPDPIKPRPGGTSTPASLGQALAGIVPGASSSSKPRLPGASGAPVLPIAATVAALAVVGVLAGRRRPRRRLVAALQRAGDRVSAMRRRHRRRHGRAPAADVLDAWRRSGTALERAAWGRRPSETPNEHAARLAGVLAHRGRLSAVVAGVMAPLPALDADRYTELSALATKAVYDAEEVDAADATRADRLDEEVRARLTARHPAPV
jgi:transglutaminase-like putative cysteine protease